MVERIQLLPPSHCQPADAQSSEHAGTAPRLDSGIPSRCSAGKHSCPLRNRHHPHVPSPLAPCPHLASTKPPPTPPFISPRGARWMPRMRAPSVSCEGWDISNPVLPLSLKNPSLSFILARRLSAAAGFDEALRRLSCHAESPGHQALHVNDAFHGGLDAGQPGTHTSLLRPSRAPNVVHHGGPGNRDGRAATLHARATAPLARPSSHQASDEMWPGRTNWQPWTLV